MKQTAAAFLSLALTGCSGSTTDPRARQPDDGGADLDSATGDADAGDGDGDPDAGGDGDGDTDAGGTGGDAGGGGNGECGWSLTLGGGALADFAADVLLLDDGSVIVVGFARMSPEGTPFSATGGFAMRVSTSGQIVWSKSFPGTNIRTVVRGATPSAVAVAGTATSGESCATHHGATDGWIAVLSVNDGALLGSACIGGDDDDSIEGVSAMNGFYRVFGSTDSHMSGDIGVNHNGGIFDAPDIMLGTWSTTDGANVWCYGGDGPDRAQFLIDRDTVFATAASGTTGDFEAYPEADEDSALFVTVDAFDLCLDPPCASSTFISNESAYGRGLAADDGWITGTSEITTGPFGCPGGAPGSQRLFVARYSPGELLSKACLGEGLERIIPMGIGTSANAVAIVGRTSADTLTGAQVDGSEEPTSDGAFIALYSASPSLAAEPSEIVMVKTARSVRLQSAAIRDDNCVIAVGEITTGASPDVYIYTRRMVP